MTDQKLELFIRRTAEAWNVPHSESVALLCLPKKKSLRLNALKKKNKDVVTEFNKDKIHLKSIEWCADAYEIIDGHDLVSQHKFSSSGLYMLQNQASFVPVLSLDPKPSEDILDMCAAPGAKTSHIAAKTFNKARIVANDSSKNRFFKMRNLMAGYGVKAEYTMYDARYLRQKLEGKKFDKILLDAPCSGEAAIDPSDPKTYLAWSMSKVKRLSRLQEKLIVTAFDLLKPGGLLIYSTCTIAPEENELIVNHLLKKRSAAVEPISIVLANSMPGITLWNGRSLSNDISKTTRLIPTPNCEAFFVAKILKPINSDDSVDTYKA